MHRHIVPADTVHRDTMHADTLHRDTTAHIDTAHRDHLAMPRQQQPQPPMEMSGPLGMPMQREGSGTAWLPDASPMYALHSMRGQSMLMLHGIVYVQYITEGSDRGDEQFGSTNWLMAMAKERAFGGHVTLRAMFSAEAATVGRCGYPDLLATGETCHGVPLHDRQHPHDLFMELAAAYEREVSRSIAFQLYGGLAGEPALGPVAYPHRISAISNPMAPISHHWIDATHITFGVVTAGLFGRKWKLESSVFNGREPDEDRYDINLDPLDSYSGRVWWLPNQRWAFQLSAGRLNEAEPGEAGQPREDITRATASATHHLPFARSSLLSTTLSWGRNTHEDEKTNAMLVESNLDLERHVFFGRAERVEKTGHDLGLEQEAPALADRTFTLGQLTGGYLHQFRPIGDLMLAGGVRLSLSFIPDDLEPVYGTRAPAGATLFVSLRPRAKRMDAHAGMSH
jgi:hypothetical protein